MRSYSDDEILSKKQIQELINQAVMTEREAILACTKLVLVGFCIGVLAYSGFIYASV